MEPKLDEARGRCVGEVRVEGRESAHWTFRKLAEGLRVRYQVEVHPSSYLEERPYPAYLVPGEVHHSRVGYSSDGGSVEKDKLVPEDNVMIVKGKDVADERYVMDGLGVSNG